MVNLTFDEQEHKYYDGDKEIISVTQMLDLVGAYSWSTKDRIKEDNTKQFIQKYAEEGKKIHKVLEDYDNEEDVDGPVIAQYEKFLDEYSPGAVELIESKVYNERMGYAGTLDRLYVRGFGENEQIVLGDIKRRGKGKKNKKDLKAYMAQLGAYAIALEPEWKVDVCLILEINGTGYNVHTFSVAECKRLWMIAFGAFSNGERVDLTQPSIVLGDKKWTEIGERIKELKEKKKKIEEELDNIKERVKDVVGEQDALIGDQKVVWVPGSPKKKLSEKKVLELIDESGLKKEDFYDWKESKGYLRV